MAQHRSALKSIRQDKKRHERNVARKSELKTRIKKVLSAVDKKDTEKSQKALAEVIPVIDQSCQKGIIHKNNAARKKSRLTKKVHSLGFVLKQKKTKSD